MTSLSRVIPLPVFLSLLLGSMYLGLASPAAHPEQIRGLASKEIELQVKPDFMLNLGMGMNELLILGLGEQSRFLRAVQVEVVLSDVLKRYADSLGLAVYSGVRETESRDMQEFTGDRVLFTVLPYSNRGIVRIPTQAAAVTKGPLPPGVIGVTDPLGPEDFPILITVQPIMKGVPDAILGRRIFLNLSLDIEKRGILNVILSRPESFSGEPVRIMLDDSEVSMKDFPKEIPSGVHRLSVSSEVFKPANVNFVLVPGQRQDIEIALEPSISTLTVDALEGAVVYLDGEKISPGQTTSGMQLTEGEHTIRFKIGDYSISRTFSVVRGRSYSASLVFDIKLKEE